MEITIGSEKFEQIELHSINLVDSWVDENIKLKTTTWVWEKRLYMWSSNENELDDFFNVEQIEYFFMLKEDLIDYLNKSKSEYFSPIQDYKNKDQLINIWEREFINISNIEENKLIVKFRKNYDSQNRYWLIIEEWKEYFKNLNKICLPRVSQLFFMKIKNFKDWKYYIYMKPFFDIWDIELDEKLTIEEEKLVNVITDVKKKEQFIRARKWQWKYRQDLLEDCPFCPITLISDDRLLIASHIKPWAKADLHEKIDPKNGFMLTPTYDLLFDRWFISFTNDKKIMVSPWLSKMTCSKLEISEWKQYLKLPIDWRENYLDYHRNNIFKK